ncbi:hypothetical protein CCB80_02250 [Armatimonadetes bacterium Uphvl-Ar1]|nr:hypothetical protein CCB80_02250 [Armatimonadetes bacterium Uphvl-Ar1]
MPFDPICLDAGHGMSNRTPGVFDPGAVAGGVREADRREAMNWFGVRARRIALALDDHTDRTEMVRRVDRAKATGCM